MFERIRIYGLLTFLLLGLAACDQQTTHAPTQKPVKADIDAVLDDWHSAASDADFDRYFGHFHDSTSIFMGTDATERWTVPEFKAFAQPYFARGRAWSFSATTRYVYFSEEGNVAWFDEELDTPNLGPSRGTGVLVFGKTGWKIAHYNLTVPIPNEIVYDVVEQIEAELKKEK